MLYAITLALVLTPSSPNPAQEPAAAVVRFVVHAPDSRGPLHLAGSFNRWQPGDAKWKLTRRGEDGAVLWMIAVSLEDLGDLPIEYKLTRGSWKTVEVLAAGDNRPNRELHPRDLTEAIDVRVEGWADDRSTVTGNLQAFDLASERLGNTRKVRVWLPPDYDVPEHAERKHPVLYLQDGQNLFDTATSFEGVEWKADETATDLIEAGTIPPIIIVGIDHAGSARTAEYNPPFTSKGGVAHYGDRYLDFLTEELMPEVERRYRVAHGPENTAIGGSSFGGNITLYAGMRHPDRFGGLLVESPVFWAFGPALMDRCSEHDTWTQRIIVSIGEKESSKKDVQVGYEEGMAQLRTAFDEQGLLPARARLVIEKGGTHHESSWSRRLAAALEFLFGKSVQPDRRRKQ